jgi:hypothetical protein
MSLQGNLGGEVSEALEGKNNVDHKPVVPLAPFLVEQNTLNISK